MKTSNSAMYTDTPCDKCGGPTIVIGHGSIWCGAEAPHPGGHFVKRVAFDRPPGREAKPRTLNPLPQRQFPASRGAVAGTRFTPPAPKAKPADEWAPDTHDFAETK